MTDRCSFVQFVSAELVEASGGAISPPYYTVTSLVRPENVYVVAGHIRQGLAFVVTYPDPCPSDD